MSFDYYWLNGCFAILKNGDAIFWHSGLNNDLNTCYETKVNENLLRTSMFSKYNYFNHFDQLYKILTEMGIVMRNAIPHNYTLKDVKKTLETGFLKPFPNKQQPESISEISDQRVTNERATIDKITSNNSAIVSFLNNLNKNYHE